MFIAVLKSENDIYTEAYLYTNMEQYREDTFSPEIETVNVIPLEVKGKNYAERKENFRNTAVEYSNTDLGGISWGELSIITAFFEVNARRYGLTQELKENCII